MEYLEREESIKYSRAMTKIGIYLRIVAVERNLKEEYPYDQLMSKIGDRYLLTTGNSLGKYAKITSAHTKCKQCVFQGHRRLVKSVIVEFSGLARPGVL